MTALVLLVAVAALLGAAGPDFFTSLSGAEEVPPVTTSASGTARVSFNRSGTALRHRLTVENIDNVTAAHIHLGAPGENGPIVVQLFGPADPPVDVPNRRVLAAGRVTADDLVGPLAGEPLSALLAEMQGGNTYVNVHTTEFPDGEIRGQLAPEADSLGYRGAHVS